ncbi:uncharacterized protein LOC142325382 isoform X2 [Lycorma delicatula]
MDNIRTVFNKQTSCCYWVTKSSILSPFLSRFIYCCSICNTNYIIFNCLLVTLPSILCKVFYRTWQETTENIKDKTMNFKAWVLYCLLSSGWLVVGNLEGSELKCVTENHHHNHQNKTTKIANKIRQKRFLTFNNDESNIRVELNFAVPFLQIPIGGKTLKHDKGGLHPVVDVNSKSLITASFLVFVLVYIVPRVIRFFIPNAMTRLSRGNNYNESEIGMLFHNTETILNAMKIDADACWQRTVCLAVQTSTKKVDNKLGSSWDKIIDGLARNEFLHFMVHGTSTFEAIKSGLMESQCNLIYHSCRLDMKDIISFIRKLSTNS